MTDNLRDDIEKAASMRSGGATWQAIAHKCQRSMETCRQWPRRYPEIWSANEAPARADRSAETISEPSRVYRSTDVPGPCQQVDPQLLLLYARMRSLQCAEQKAARQPTTPTRLPCASPPARHPDPNPPIAHPATRIEASGSSRRELPRPRPGSANIVMALITAALLGFTTGHLFGSLNNPSPAQRAMATRMPELVNPGGYIASSENPLAPATKNESRPIAAPNWDSHRADQIVTTTANADSLARGSARRVQFPEPLTSSRVAMPLLPWKTAERRIGVLGPNWAGKTVFLTSLINHLSSHDPRYFHLGKGRVSAEVRKFRRVAEDRGWPGFDYDQHRERLVHRRWPTKTTDRAQYVCQFERSDWTFNDALLKLYDLPGERINDVAMVKEGSDTYDTWSDGFVKRIEKDIGYADRFEAYLKRLDDPTINEAEILNSYKVALGNLRLAYKPYITPSTYVLDRQGQAIRGRDPEQLAHERYVGLKPGEEFAPMPRSARLKHSRIATLFGNRFDTYCDEVVWPLVAGIKSCHSLVILVDVMRILASDTGTHDDYQELLRDMLRSLNPRENFLKRGVRWASEMLLPHDWRPGWISRIAFVAPKSDLVHPDDRNRLKHLLKQMVERDARDCDGIKFEFFNVAAVRATEAVPGGEARRLLTGSTMLDSEGKPIDPGERQKFIVSALPDEWPRQWKVGDYVFPSVYPEIPARRGCPPEHIGLDSVFNFLCW